MQQPADVSNAADTTLEYQYGINKSQKSSFQSADVKKPVDEASILGPAFSSSFGRKLMLVVVSVALISLIGILILEEMERSHRKKMHQLPVADHVIAPQLSSGPVVTRENWKSLQDTADVVRQHRMDAESSSTNRRARIIQERAAREAAERERRVIQQMHRDLPMHQEHEGKAWVGKGGGPHSGAQSSGYW